MNLAVGRIDHQPFKVRFLYQLSEDEVPMMSIAPSFVATIHGAEFTVLRWQVTPWRTRPDDPKTSVHENTVIVCV